MAEDNRVERLSGSLATSTGIDRNKILSILYSRIAAGIELKDKPPDGYFDPNETWNIANRQLLEITRIDPRQALQMALSFINLPASPDQKQEQANGWVRTSGLSILGFDEIKQTLADFLTENSPEAQSLKTKLQNLMDADLSSITNSSQFGDSPIGFSAIQSTFVFLGLNDELASAAKKRVLLPDFKTAYELLVNSSEDCAYLRLRISAVLTILN